MFEKQCSWRDQTVQKHLVWKNWNVWLTMFDRLAMASCSKSNVLGVTKWFKNNWLKKNWNVWLTMFDCVARASCSKSNVFWRDQTVQKHFFWKANFKCFVNNVWSFDEGLMQNKKVNRQQERNNTYLYDAWGQLKCWHFIKWSSRS